MYLLRHSLRLLVLLLTLSLGVGSQLFGQYYPVHATVQWPSPQSPHLVDYYSGSRDRLIITLHNRDLQQPLLLARLRLQIKSNGFLAQTREELSYPQLELMAGVPTRLTATDLMPYLRPESLLINGRLRNGQFPTGFTEISVQVVDYYSQQVLSSWHTARAYLDSKQPPMLNLPQRDEQVGYRDPLFIRFQWYPRHQGLAGTEYEFVLKELPDNGAAPQAAFAYGNEIYRTRTRHTTLNYTHLEPILLPNRRYAWQVQAIARDGVDEIGMFEHGGFSEIYWFTLNENCPVPTGLKADPRYAKVDFSWNRVVGATGYMLACRPKTSKDIYEWSEVQSYSERMTLAQLKPGWTYEWRVGTLCTGDKPIYSAIQEVTLPKTNLDLLRDCGKEPPRANLSPDPALDIQVGDTVTIGGDYPMLITQLQSLGDGWYSGRGTTRLSSIIELPRVALRFDRLRINIEKCQIDGLVEAIYDEKSGKIADLDKIDDGGKTVKSSKLRIRERKVDFALREMPEMSFDHETGELEVTDAEGKPQRIKLDLPEGGDYASAFPMIITDSKGDSYQLSPEESSEVGSSGASSDTLSSEGRVGTKQTLKVERVDKIGAFDESRLAHDIGLVRFEPSAQARYAFDDGIESWYQRSVKLDEYYKPFAKGYIAPWKLIPTGEQDVVTARYEGKKSIDLSRVRFATSPNSPALPAELHEGSKTWSLKLPATDAQSSYDVFAIYEGQVIGKLRVVSYPKQRHKLTLVPVNEAKLDKEQIERELNSIYDSVGIHFDVEVDDRMRRDYSWDRDGDGKLSIVGKSFFGRVREVKESAEMDYLKKAYTQLAGTLDGVYLFVVDAAGGLEAQPKDLLGEMPRRSRFGYIFSGNSPNGGVSALSHTIAHELGHGLFTLQHTFDDEYGGTESQGQTRNLMDYATGKELAAFQWNVLANPAAFTKFDRAEELALHSSKSCVVSISAELSQAIIQSGKAVSMPSGKAFRLPAGAVIKELFYKDSSRYPASMGSVASFELNGVRYNTYYRVSDSQFAFYGANITRRFKVKDSSLPVVHIQIDEATRKISVESKAYPLAKEDFSCAEETKRSIEAEHLEYTQAVKVDTTLGTRDWERGLRIPTRTLFTIGRVSQEHIAFSLQSLPKDSVPLSEQESIIQELTSQVSLFGRGKTFLGEVLEDKLETYRLRNSSRFVVVQAKVKTASLDQREWNRLALKVFERSGLGEKDILVTVPYVGLPSLGRSGRVLHMIGVATGSKVSVAFEKLREDHEPAQEQVLGRSIRDFVLDLFTHTAKRTTTYRGYFNASRCITILEDNHKGEAVPGYSYNVAVIPYIQQGVDGLVDIVKHYNDRENIRRTGQKSGVTPEGFSSSENERWLREHYAPALLALSEDADNLKSYKRHEVRTPIHYRERYLEADNGRNLKNYQAYLLQYAYENVLEGLNASVRSGFTFKREHSFTDKTDWFLARYVDEAVYSTLDVASIILGFVGMDTAPDILNVFYSSLRGNYSNAGLAGMSLLVIGPTAYKPVKIAWEYTDKHLFRLIRDHAEVSIKAISKEAIESGSKQLGRGATNEALERLLKSDTKGVLRGVSHSNIIDAQELLIRSRHPKLAQQVDALRVVVDIRNHRNFKAFGLTDELLGRIASTINTDGYAQIVSNLRVLIDKFDPNKVKRLEVLVNNLGHAESSFREGAEWTLRYLANNADEFTGASKISFEVLEILPDGRKRIADMVVEYPRGSKVYYEFKSVRNLPPKDFIQQFSNDLTRLNAEMNNLKWVFDGKKIQAKDLQKLRNKLESIITNKIAQGYGYDSANAMIEVLFNKVFVVR